MKNYLEVVHERFDSEADNTHSVYAPDCPTGKYIREVLFNGLNEFLSHYSEKRGDLHTKTLLDIGCGSGGMIEYFISKGFSPQNVTGIDLSTNRIEKAQKQYPNVSFFTDDVLTFELNQKAFDLITAFDLFSHLTTKEQLIQGLTNVHHHLEDTGVFLWYDIFSKDHYCSPANADSWGFNKEQMISLGKEAGFEVVYYKSFFKYFFNRYHSIYQVKRFSTTIVKLMEKILPGQPGNVLFAFKKQCLTADSKT